MASLLIIAASISAQTSGMLAAPPQATKKCPDGSVLRVSDRCIELPDHRYLYSLPPAATMLTAQWWCLDNKRPSKAKIRITEKPALNEQGQPVRKHAFQVELVSLRVEGRAVTDQVVKKARDTLEPFNTVKHFTGTCRNLPNGGMEPLLSVHGFGLKNRNEIRVEIPLL